MKSDLFLMLEKKIRDLHGAADRAQQSGDINRSTALKKAADQYERARKELAYQMAPELVLNTKK